MNIPVLNQPLGGLNEMITNMVPIVVQISLFPFPLLLLMRPLRTAYLVLEKRREKRRGKKEGEETEKREQLMLID